MSDDHPSSPEPPRLCKIEEIKRETETITEVTDMKTEQTTIETEIERMHGELDTLIDSDVMEKASALGVARVFRSMESLMLRTRYDQVRECDKLRHELLLSQERKDGFAIQIRALQGALVDTNRKVETLMDAVRTASNTASSAIDGVRELTDKRKRR